MGNRNDIPLFGMLIQDMSKPAAAEPEPITACGTDNEDAKLVPVFLKTNESYPCRKSQKITRINESEFR